MTTVKEVARVTPCNTGRLAELLCDVTLDDGSTHRVYVERDGRGDWQLDRTYPDHDLQATLLDAAGSLADTIEAQQSSPMFASGRQTVETVVKELWRYTPGAPSYVKNMLCDVKCNGKAYRILATRDKAGWHIEETVKDTCLQRTLLNAVKFHAMSVEDELSKLENRTSR